MYKHIHTCTHCKNKIVKITNLLVITDARNNLNCNLIGRVDCYGYTCTNNCNLNILMLSNRCTK